MSFLHSHIELRDTGDPHLGRGLFAREAIRKDEIVFRNDGVVIGNGSLARIPTEMLLHWCYDADDMNTFCPSDFKDPSPDWWFNHSCDSNAGAGRDLGTMVAMRDIAANESISIDYVMINSSPPADWEMECFCGTSNCRKVITANDWMIPGLQEKYRGYFWKNIQKKLMH